MGLIKEPLEVDFIVDPRPLSEKEQLIISEIIKADKAQTALAKKRKIKVRSSGTTQTTV